MSGKLRSKRVVLILTSIATLLFAFNNCSSQTGKSANRTPAGDGQNLSPDQSGPAYNGGGYGGKTTYAFFASTPLCAADPSAPEKTIQLGGGNIVLNQNMCGGQSSSNLSAQDLFANAYDPYYLVHDDEVFVDQALVQTSGAGQRAAVFAFCYNPDYKNASLGTTGIDFAIRHHSVFDNGWQVTNIGHAVYGNGTLAPLSIEERGRLPDAPPESPLFISASGQYRLEMSRTTPTRGTAVLILDGRERVPMNCYFLR